jgi:hypothetical protein
MKKNVQKVRQVHTLQTHAHFRKSVHESAPQCTSRLRLRLDVYVCIMSILHVCVCIIVYVCVCVCMCLYVSVCVCRKTLKYEMCISVCFATDFGGE